MSSFSLLSGEFAPEQSYECLQNVPGNFEGTFLAMGAYLVDNGRRDHKEDKVHNRTMSGTEYNS